MDLSSRRPARQSLIILLPLPLLHRDSLSLCMSCKTARCQILGQRLTRGLRHRDLRHLRLCLLSLVCPCCLRAQWVPPCHSASNSLSWTQQLQSWISGCFCLQVVVILCLGRLPTSPLMSRGAKHSCSPSERRQASVGSTQDGRHNTPRIHPHMHILTPWQNIHTHTYAC